MAVAAWTSVRRALRPGAWTSAPLGGQLALAVSPQLVLFATSLRLEGEPEILFAILYVATAGLTATWVSPVPALVAGIVAAGSVVYHYLDPGSGAGGWNGPLFLISTLVVVQLVVMGSRALVGALQAEARARAARDALLEAITHDLRQPISALTLELQFAVRQLEGGRVAAAREKIERAYLTIDRMSAMLADLVDVGRMEAGGYRIAAEEVRFRPLVERLSEEFALAASAKDQRFELALRLAPNEDAVSGDPVQLARVMANLVGNAQKFTPPGGRVRVEVERGPEEGGVSVRVLDTGPGVREESIPHLFERRWQEGETAHLGSGLGLYICRGIIEAHGGRIWYAPGADGGAGFSFRLVGSPPSSRAAGD